MNEHTTQHPATLIQTMPAYRFRVRSRSVRHADLISFLIKGVDEDEAEQLLREFVEDLIQAGLRDEE